MISQRYVHPIAEPIESAFTMLESYNAAQQQQLREEHEQQAAVVQ